VRAYLADVTKRFGSPGLNRTEITESVPHLKLFTGWDLIMAGMLENIIEIACALDRNKETSWDQNLLWFQISTWAPAVAKRSPFHWWSTALKIARRVQNRRDVQTNTPKLDIYTRTNIPEVKLYRTKMHFPPYKLPVAVDTSRNFLRVCRKRR